MLNSKICLNSINVDFFFSQKPYIWRSTSIYFLKLVYMEIRAISLTTTMERFWYLWTGSYLWVGMLIVRMPPLFLLILIHTIFRPILLISIKLKKLFIWVDEKNMVLVVFAFSIKKFSILFIEQCHRRTWV